MTHQLIKPFCDSFEHCHLAFHHARGNLVSHTGQGELQHRKRKVNNRLIRIVDNTIGLPGGGKSKWTEWGRENPFRRRPLHCRLCHRLDQAQAQTDSTRRLARCPVPPSCCPDSWRLSVNTVVDTARIAGVHVDRASLAGMCWKLN